MTALLLSLCLVSPSIATAPLAEPRLDVARLDPREILADRNRDAGNYANVSPLMDILFGTYRCPDHEPERLGTDEPPRSYLGHMFGPFVPTETESRSAAEAAAG